MAVDVELVQLVHRLRARSGQPGGLPLSARTGGIGRGRGLGYTPPPDLPGSRYRVAGKDTMGWPVGGWDSTVGTVPDDVPTAWPDLDDRLAVLLAEYTQVSARALGHPLHHAEWVLTGDPGLVAQVARHPDHPDCFACARAAVFAPAYMAGTGRPVLLGVIYWARV
jgi:hypothetical protein